MDIVVGAPGRVKDLMDRGDLSLSDVRHVILDEVDRMLDMGFVDAVDGIIKNIYAESNSGERPQTLLFSATIPRWMKDVSSKFFKNVMALCSVH